MGDLRPLRRATCELLFLPPTASRDVLSGRASRRTVALHITPSPPDLYLERPPKAFIFQLNTKEIQPHDKQIYLFFMIILCTYTIPRAQTQLCVDASRFVEMWGHMTDFRSVILPKTNLWMSAVSNSHLLKVVCSGITKVVGSIPASCSHSHVKPKAPKAALVFFFFLLR